MYKFIMSEKNIFRFSMFLLVLISVIFLHGCDRYEPVALDPTFNLETIPESSSISISIEETVEAGDENEAESESETEPEAEEDDRVPTRVKGIYVASKPLANEEFMSSFWGVMDNTELNAVVIDIKDDYGKITYNMQGPEIIKELDSVEVAIEDMPSLMSEFKKHGIYTIARIVAMRDPHISSVKPEWCLTNPDGTVYKDGSGYSWVNPYKTEYWDYLLAIGQQAAHDGFDEIQFDYMRFCTEKGSDECVYDDEDVKGRDKISVITELVQYLYDNLRPEGVFVSVDCFGTIIQSKVDSRAVGQSYSQLAATLDYICPMIYPSHYSSGNFGLEHPDLQPYEAIKGALRRSKSELGKAREEGDVHQAIVRPWLQSFTASWLGAGNYMQYDAYAVRQEIQGVYDSGYDEWILWSASVNYFYDGLLNDAEAEAEDEYIKESRAALPPEEDPENEEETFPSELQDALDGDELRPEDESILMEDGPIIQYEKGFKDVNETEIVSTEDVS